MPSMWIFLPRCINTSMKKSVHDCIIEDNAKNFPRFDLNDQLYELGPSCCFTVSWDSASSTSLTWEKLFRCKILGPSHSLPHNHILIGDSHTHSKSSPCLWAKPDAQIDQPLSSIVKSSMACPVWVLEKKEEMRLFKKVSAPRDNSFIDIFKCLFLETLKTGSKEGKQTMASNYSLTYRKSSTEAQPMKEGRRNLTKLSDPKLSRHCGWFITLEA